jgi:hypothetical protein
MSQFEKLFESEGGRFQNAGFWVGDRVRFKEDALKHEYVTSRAASFQDIIKACSDASFDLNLRVGSLKSIYPTTTQNYVGSNTDSPDAIFADIYIEYAPGLYRNPMTVPVDIIEVMDDGNNRGPVPDSVVRKNKIHGPKEQEAEQNNNAKGFDVNLKNKNVVIPGGNNWDDSKPGAGNF